MAFIQIRLHKMCSLIVYICYLLVQASLEDRFILSLCGFYFKTSKQVKSLYLALKEFDITNYGASYHTFTGNEVGTVGGQ